MAEGHAEFLLRDAAARHAAGEFEAAEAGYRAVLALAPEQPDALNLWGVLARQRGDLAAALERTGRALRLRPDSPVYLASHGAALAEAGRLPEAARHLLAALKLRPRDPVTLRNYGQALAALGRPGEAVAPLRAAISLTPEAPEPRIALAHALRESGDPAGAAEAVAPVAAGEGPLAEQARFLLAALGRGAVPERAPAAYVRDLFDLYAPRFDAELQERLGYRTPALLAGLLEDCGIAPDASRGVLDLGCGTGLSGVALRPFARRLEGLDLSPRMLAAARARGLYDALHEADLVEFLPQQPQGYDLIAAADVLNYLGDLGPALAGLAVALPAGGHAAFSIETGAGGDYTLGEGLRYRHDPDRVAARAEAAGLLEDARSPAVLRREQGQEVMGMLFVFRRAGR